MKALPRPMNGFVDFLPRTELTGSWRRAIHRPIVVQNSLEDVHRNDCSFGVYGAEEFESAGLHLLVSGLLLPELRG